MAVDDGYTTILSCHGINPRMISRINLDCYRISFTCQLTEYFIENTRAAPANEPIVKRLVWPVIGRYITPAKTVLDHMNEA